ncbi:hypothetical protein SYK_06810 [Pseudodesulfovibrio nedwellii]|uniref:Excisionase n=1 Tax=Pseudodesulfovibrio nedwellii TaxID=2973072 RepID=A0ABN6S0S2_9BACT|nr:hypothetical protein [Pseudodesulfovibrio nedwellii]BDQ35912.1 hypothetical protein SYK_02720 [Pseudodesulfovibrio nedwellii]BDQ36321.1 hypothetical protein SYK_06810 [Pseudodesulfovibrio nedwellii]
MIIRPVETVKGWKRIAKRFGRDERTVKKWQKEGAPIFFIDGFWIAEVAEVWSWLKDPESYAAQAVA